MNRMHPEDLRALCAALLALSPLTPVDDGTDATDLAIRDADHLLAELAHTAKPEPQDDLVKWSLMQELGITRTPDGGLENTALVKAMKHAEAKLKEKDAWIEHLTGTTFSERMLPALQAQLAEARAECDMLKAGYRWWNQPTLAKAREEGARAERDRIKNALRLNTWTFALSDGTTAPGYLLKDVNAVLEAKP